VPIALGLYLAWAHRDWDRATKSLGLLAASAGAVLGGWLGFSATSGLSALVTTTIGAAAGGNLALIAASIFRERSARAPAVNSATDSDDVGPDLATSVYHFLDKEGAVHAS
jgi:outer membrane lipoprotein SlyB